MKLYIKGGKVFLPDNRTLYKTLVIEDQIICDIIPNIYTPGNNDKVVDATGKWVVPGLIDIHAHGALGKDAMDGTWDAIHTLGRFFCCSWCNLLFTNNMDFHTRVDDESHRQRSKLPAT